MQNDKLKDVDVDVKTGHLNQVRHTKTKTKTETEYAFHRDIGIKLIESGQMGVIETGRLELPYPAKSIQLKVYRVGDKVRVEVTVWTEKDL